jgi:hypothetical protein
VEGWQFSYADKLSVTAHSAVRRTADFIRQNRDLFPGKRIPEAEAELAVLAIKGYEVFIDDSGEGLVDPRSSNKIELVCTIVETLSRFERTSRYRNWKNHSAGPDRRDPVKHIHCR